MSIELKITVSTMAEAIAILTAANAGATPSNPVPVTATVTQGNEKPAKPKADHKPKAEATPSAEKQPESKPSSDSTDSTTADTPAVKYEDLQAMVIKVVALGDAGKNKLREILAGFDLATFKGSDEAIWPAALAQVKAAHEELSMA